jgi:hypothetical protein
MASPATRPTLLSLDRARPQEDSTVSHRTIVVGDLIHVDDPSPITSSSLAVSSHVETRESSGISDLTTAVDSAPRNASRAPSYPESNPRNNSDPVDTTQLPDDADGAATLTGPPGLNALGPHHLAHMGRIREGWESPFHPPDDDQLPGDYREFADLQVVAPDPVAPPPLTSPERQPSPCRHVLRLRNLGDVVKSADVRAQCSAFGEVRQVVVPNRRVDTIHGRTAFVTFTTSESTRLAAHAFSAAGFEVRLCRSPPKQMRRPQRPNAQPSSGDGRESSPTTSADAAGAASRRQPLTTEEVLRRAAERRRQRQQQQQQQRQQRQHQSGLW